MRFLVVFACIGTSLSLAACAPAAAPTRPITVNQARDYQWIKQAPRVAGEGTRTAGGFYVALGEPPTLTLTYVLQRTSPSPSGESTLGVDLLLADARATELKTERLFESGPGFRLFATGDPAETVVLQGTAPVGVRELKTDETLYSHGSGDTTVLRSLRPGATELRLVVYIGRTPDEARRGVALEIPIASVPAVARIVRSTRGMSPDY